MLNNLPKRSRVEKLLPCTEYILQRSDRILVHLVGDLPKAIVELSNGSVDRLQPTRSFPRQLLALVIHSLGFTHYKTSSCPLMPGKCTKPEEMNPITLKRRQLGRENADPLLPKLQAVLDDVQSKRIGTLSAVRYLGAPESRCRLQGTSRQRKVDLSLAAETQDRSRLHVMYAAEGIR
jgi:hypothetical protein